MAPGSDSTAMSDPARVLESSRRDALFVAALWIGSCIYTVGFAACFAYRSDPRPPLILGIPTWVVWGILAPWAVCLAATCWYAFRGMRDEELGEDDGSP